MSEGALLSRRIVLGLGNPGERYISTRHNVGFRVVEELAKRRGIEIRSGECNSRLGFDEELFLVAPQTYMNRSGYAARCLRESYGFEPEDLLVVYDEIHLPLGKLRLRRGGSPAGHRGMESILENLGTAGVPRLRLGVASESGPPAGEELVDFVLTSFEGEEASVADDMIRSAADACLTWAREGIETAMQQFNG